VLKVLKSIIPIYHEAALLEHTSSREHHRAALKERAFSITQYPEREWGLSYRLEKLNVPTIGFSEGTISDEQDVIEVTPFDRTENLLVTLFKEAPTITSLSCIKRGSIDGLGREDTATVIRCIVRAYKNLLYICELSCTQCGDHRCVT
jgi:hypothetical protein